MVKIERLQEWADSDKCLSIICNGKTFVSHFCNQFINANRKSHVEQGYNPTPYILFENGSISY